MAATKRNVTYKCLYCDKRFNRKELVDHINEYHEDMIPEDFTALRLVFNYVNKKPMSYHGKCTECGKATRWDEKKGRYDRQCGSKACHDSYVKKFEENMMKTRGTTRISATKEGQQKMLANRKISGTYTMRDGTKKTYTGSYERKALEFMDKVLEIESNDIMCPGPILEYTFNGKTHIYITDFYYQPYNLIIEVKDGGNNPNKRNMPEYRAKQIAKEQFIIKNTNYNYLRLTDNNLQQLINIFADLKYQLIENTGERVIHVNEGKYIEGNPLVEHMNALMSGFIPGMRDSDDAYITMNLQNNVFSHAVSDDRFDKSIILNNAGIVEPHYLCDIKESRVFKLPMSFTEACNRLKPLVGKKTDFKTFYETLMQKKLYTEDQLYTLEEFYPYKDIEGIDENFNRYLFGEEIDHKLKSLMEEAING